MMPSAAARCEARQEQRHVLPRYGEQVPQPRCTKDLGHARGLPRVVAQHETTRQRRIVRVRGAQTTVDQRMHSICGTMPRRHSAMHRMNRDVAQFTLHMSARGEPKTAGIEGRALRIEHDEITGANREQGSPAGAVLGEAESFARDLYYEGDCAASALSVTHRRGDARELAELGCAERIPM